MRLEGVEIENFGSIGKTDYLDLTDIHTLAILGENGGGKTTILRAIKWGLWGKFEKEAALDDLIRLGQDTMRVTVVWRGADRERLRVKRVRSNRTKTGESNLFFEQQNPDGTWKSIARNTIPATQEEIIRRLGGLDYDLASMTAFAFDGQMEAFMRAEPGDRHAAFSKVCGTQRFSEDYREVVKELLRDAKRDLTNIAPQIERLRATADALEAREGTLALARDELEAARQGVRTCEAALEAAQATHNGLLVEAARINAKAEALSALRKALDDLTRDWSAKSGGLAGLRQRMTAIGPEAEPVDPTALDAARQRSEDAAARAQELKAQAGDRKREAAAALDGDEEALRNAETRLRAAIQARTDNEREIDRVRKDAVRDHNQKLADAKTRHGTALRLAGIAAGALTEAQNRVERLKRVPCQRPIPLADATTTVCVEKECAACPLIEDAVLARARIPSLEAEARKADDERDAAREALDAILAVAAPEPAPAVMNPLNEKATALGRAALDLEAETDNARRRRTAARLSLTDAENVLDLFMGPGITGTPVPPNESDAMTEARAALAASRVADMNYRALAQQADAARTAREQRASLTAQIEAQAAVVADLDEKRKAKASEVDALVLDPDLSRMILDEIKTAAAAKEKARTALTDAQEGVGSWQGQIATLETQIEASKAAARDIADLDRKANDLRVRIADLGDLDTACRDVPTLIIEAVAPEIEDHANVLLDKVNTKGLSLRVITQEANQDGSIRETFKIRCADYKGERPYCLFSTGERFRLAWAFRVAMCHTLVARRGAPLETFFIDEGFGSLDAEGKEAFSQVFAASQSMFDFLGAITHILEIAAGIPNRLWLTNGPDGSTWAFEE